MESGLVQTLHIVAVHEPQAGQGRDAQQGAQLVQKTRGLLPQRSFFLYINASYHLLFLHRGQRPPADIMAHVLALEIHGLRGGVGVRQSRL